MGQRHYTNPEQSERLLFLGIPASTADCFMNDDGTDIRIWKENYPITQFIEYANGIYHHRYRYCWSVGQLLEISIKMGRGEKVPNEICIGKYSFDPSLIENIIRRLEHLGDLSVNDLNFSVFED